MAILTRAEYQQIKKESDLTAEVLKECLSYDPLTGVFTWLLRPQAHFKTKKAHAVAEAKSSGKKAGWDASGYIMIGLFGLKCRAHRLAWLYMTDSLPPAVIDHIDGETSNNRFANLRAVSDAENKRNMPRASNNTSGVTGVSKLKGRSGKAKPWRAYIKDGGKQICLGVYNTKAEAVLARKNAEIKHGFHENHGADRPTVRSRC